MYVILGSIPTVFRFLVVHYFLYSWKSFTSSYEEALPMMTTLPGDLSSHPFPDFILYPKHLKVAFLCTLSHNLLSVPLLQHA